MAASALVETLGGTDDEGGNGTMDDDDSACTSGAPEWTGSGTTFCGDGDKDSDDSTGLTDEDDNCGCELIVPFLAFESKTALLVRDDEFTAGDDGCTLASPFFAQTSAFCAADGNGGDGGMIAAGLGVNLLLWLGAAHRGISRRDGDRKSVV